MKNISLVSAVNQVQHYKDTVDKMIGDAGFLSYPVADEEKLSDTLSSLSHILSKKLEYLEELPGYKDGIKEMQENQIRRGLKLCDIVERKVEGFAPQDYFDALLALDRLIIKLLQDQNSSEQLEALINDCNAETLGNIVISLFNHAKFINKIGSSRNMSIVPE